MKLSEYFSHPECALLVVDQQIDFEPGGALPVPEGDQIVERISELMMQFENVILTQDSHPAGHISFASSYEEKKPFDILQKSEVMSDRVRSRFSKQELLEYLEKVPGESQVLWPDHCVVGSKGCEFDPRLPVERARLKIQKGTRLNCDSYSAFFENDGTPTELSSRLREMKIETLVLAGLAGDYCVYWTATDAIKEGFRIVFDESLTRFVNFPKGSRERVLKHLRSLSIER